jgi:hypothetical protein
MSTHAIEPAIERPLGYQQITSLSASTGLTTPEGARYARIACTGQDVRWRDDGTAPTASVGMPLPVGAEMLYSGKLEALKFIEQSASAVLNIAYYA